MINLSKGENVSLTKENPALSSITVGLGWDVRTTDGAPFDLDTSAILLNADGKMRSGNDIVFYNNLKSTCGSIEHLGDNRTGAGEGDDECLKVNLAAVPAEIEKVLFVVSIYDADVRAQNFGMVNKAFIRLVNNTDNAELARFDLSEDASTSTTMIFGELYRHNDEWKFRAVGQGMKQELAELLKNYQ